MYFYHVHVNASQGQCIFTYRITRDEKDIVLLQVHEGEFNYVTLGDIDKHDLLKLIQYFNQSYIERDVVYMMTEYLTGYSGDLAKHEQFGQEVFHADVEIEGLY
jgi:hypothetical protein